jgi:glutamine phosphoribosylpyrophosphate amidotransferase
MCGLVGVVAVDEAQGAALLERLLRQAAIRGLHATGVAWLAGDAVALDVRSVPAYLYCDSMPDFDTSGLVAVGHCRYSTSGGAQHQPIGGAALAIAHNGVVSQEPPEAWEALYGVAARTDNDSELLLRARERGMHPLIAWPEASIAAVEVAEDGSLRAYRNGKRPLCVAVAPGLVAIASTEDILTRAGVPNAERIQAGTEVRVRLEQGSVRVDRQQVASFAEWCP